MERLLGRPGYFIQSLSMSSIRNKSDSLIVKTNEIAGKRGLYERERRNLLHFVIARFTPPSTDNKFIGAAIKLKKKFSFQSLPQKPEKMLF